MKYIVLFISILFILACNSKENKAGSPETSQIHTSDNEIISGLESNKIKKKIKAFYRDLYHSRDPNHRIGTVQITSAKTVYSNYVDSVKLALYLSGMEKLDKAIGERDKLLERLNKKADSYQSKGNKSKAEEIRSGMEKYETRNAIQNEELKELKERMEVLNERLKNEEQTLDTLVEVFFKLEAILNNYLVSDSSSLIFRKNHEIEDMLKDGVWQAENL